MAEIKIEKKTPIWPWILAALVIAALLYFFFFRDREAEQEVIEEVDETTMINPVEVTPQNPAVYAPFEVKQKQVA